MTGKYILLDTDVLSFLLRGDPQAKPYARSIVGSFPVITFQTRAELLRWPLERHWGKGREAKMRQHLQSYPVIESGPELGQKWAELRAVGRQLGRTVGDGDIWIAAAALVYGIPLATHNRRHFSWMVDLGLKLVCHAPPLNSLDP